VAANLSLAGHVLSKARLEEIKALARPWFEAILKRIGYEPVAGEKQTTAILRDQLIWDAIRYGSQEAAQFAARQFEALTDGGQVHPDIMKSVMLAGARAGDAQTLEWFRMRFASSVVEHERVNILTAMGGFRETAQLEAVGRFILEEVPPRNKFVPVMALADNPAAVDFLWQWYRDNLAALEQTHPMIYERVIAAVISAAGLGAPDEVEPFFTAYLAKHSQAGDVIRLSLERLRINLQMRANNGG
jgi:tricorn protease interacting factor F2/3